MKVICEQREDGFWYTRIEDADGVVVSSMQRSCYTTEMESVTRLRDFIQQLTGTRKSRMQQEKIDALNEYIASLVTEGGSYAI